ncbi:ATP-dependent nucleolar rna [Cyclospora cayetanensis]|uniref:RNA helicase n=1 Tax=Cyclospora cayetanensis TaxID=88456 RepID=A0A1D3D4H6_9EIME|nr:ATP-dependent nucleolar rna [Cyclospora cayetanensis]
MGERVTLPPFSAIVLVPTKELCIQVYGVLLELLKYTNDIVTVSHTAGALPRGASGGALLVPTTVIVGTPTGLLQYLEQLRQQQPSIELQLSLEMLVVDEADLLFAFGFEKDTRRLLQLLPSTASRHYQSLLVSATQNQELSQLQSLMLHKPLIIRIEEETGKQGQLGAPGSIGEFYFQVPTDSEKWMVAYAFLRLGLVPLKCLVFCKDVANVYALRLFLDRFGIPSCVLSPTLPVAAREQQIQAFNQGLVDILITCDGQCGKGDDPFQGVSKEEDDKIGKGEGLELSNESRGTRKREQASKAKDAEFAGHRGLDLQGVACVFNFDAPASFKSYVHRIGRTARGGAAGVAVTLIDASQEEQKMLLQQLFTLRRSLEAHGESTLTPLSLQLQDIECFRYRVEDVRRGLTKRVIAAAVARDLQQQLLNSRKLKEFFERNPRDREVLKRACKQLKDINVSKGHLEHLPDYLMTQTQPTQMTAVQLAIQQQKAGEGTGKGHRSGARRRSASDPLKSFKAAVDRGTSAWKRKGSKSAAISRATQLAKMPRHPDEVPAEALPAISGLQEHLRRGVPHDCLESDIA